MIAKLACAFIVLFAFDARAREPISPPPQTKAVRARDLGIPFDGTPGKFNAITDVAGVEVGYTTLISGEGKIEVGKGPVRTGVTAIIPRGHDSLNDPVYAGVFSLNGNGEMTGTAWVEESGFLEGPVIITNTHSVGVARDASIAWRIKRGAADKTGYWWSLPVVAETWDGWLNDINGFHVKPEHVFNALDTAHGGDRGGERRRRHRNDLLRIQRRQRNRIAQGRSESRTRMHLRVRLPSAYLCRRIADGDRNSRSQEFRSAKKFRARFTKRKPVPSSSSLRLMRHCFRIN